MKARLLGALRLLILGAAFSCMAIATAHAQAGCPPACAGQTLNTPNYSHAEFPANTSFQGATIIGGVFVKARLNGANFNGATFKSADGHPTQTPDFTFADLTNATFVGAKFEGPTYFTYATLTCADFSNTDLDNGNAVFGDEPLIYTHDPNHTGACRVKFQHTTINCEFIDDWKNFDLTGAIVSACLSKLAGRDFSYALMPQVNFIGAYLAGVDFSNAALQNAKFSKANLTGASFYHAALSNVDTHGAFSDAATFESAHLKNVNLSNAQLSGVTFTNTNFYGTTAANSAAGCKTTQATKEDPNAGFTLGCSAAKAAIMTSTTLVDAYLFGVDFTLAQIKGADFTHAVLAGATFATATIDVNAEGVATQFVGAYLQGANLESATTANMTDAFIDFSKGNILFIDLGDNVHNSFACGNPSTCIPASGKDVCVIVKYDNPTSIPAPPQTNITCPNGNAGNCGTGGAPWKSSLDIGESGNDLPPQGWYLNDATYTNKTPLADVCNKQGYVQNW